MLNGKFLSVKNIIAKVYRDLQIKEEEAFTDIIEWAAEALDFIHVYPQYDIKPACIEVCNYKGELPCDYIGMEMIEYNGYNLKYSTNVFGPQDTTTSSRYLTPYSYNQKKIENAVFVDPSCTNYFPNLDSVKLENGYIKTSFKTGKLMISYISMIMDEDGYPMVPDHVSFREALYWYIVYKYLYSKVLNGDINPQFYEDAYQKWQWYCNQAGAEAMMPDLITLENIKRSFLALKLNVNKFDNFYNNLNLNY